MKRLMLCALMLAVSCASAHADVAGVVSGYGRQYYEPEWHNVTTDYETPHTKWGRTLVGGRLQMLLIAPRATQRDTAELAQRLDLDYEVLCTYAPAKFGWHEKVGRGSIRRDCVNHVIVAMSVRIT